MGVSTVQALRAAIARGEWKKPTSGLAQGFTQANVVILPKKYAFDFLLFCGRNERPCPVIDVCESGIVAPPVAGPGADIRTQIPRYRIYRRGEFEQEVEHIRDHFTEDMVTFLLGCSFTFEQDLLDAGVPVRHIELDRNVPMYITNRECRPAGVFSGPMVVRHAAHSGSVGGQGVGDHRAVSQGARRAGPYRRSRRSRDTRPAKG